MLALDKLATIDAELVQSLRAELRDWERRERPRLVLLGEYNAGKTSLLARLRAELGGELPDGSRIAANPTTDRPGEARLGSLCVVDTPGLGGGEEGHDDVAHDQALHADALVLALPVSLFTGDIELARSLLDGSAWGGEAAPPALIVVTCVDRLNPSPIDDEVGFAETCRVKADEIGRRLGAWGVTAPELRFVAADPFGAVGNRTDAPLHDYARQAWDGVAALVEALNALAAAGARARPEALARHARRRTLRRALELRRAASELDTLAAELQSRDPASMLPVVGAVVAREAESLRSMLHRSVEAVAQRVRSGEALTPGDLDAALGNVSQPLVEWRVAAAAAVQGALEDGAVDFAVPFSARAAWTGAPGDARVEPWADFSPVVRGILQAAGTRWKKDDKARADVDKVYDWMDWKAKPWEKVKLADRTRKLGEGALDAAPRVAEALAMVDGLRAWMTERANALQRADADRRLGQAVDGVADGVLRGRPGEPGLLSWWDGYREATLNERELRDQQVAALRAEGAALTHRAAALEEWARS